MVTRFGKPSVIITTDGETAKGSARNVDGFSIIDCLTACKDLLSKFGGHTGAGGFSLDCANITAFRQRIYEYCAQKHGEIGSSPVVQLQCDLLPDVADLSIDNIEKLKMLAPFGEGNPVPVFCLQGCRIVHKRPLKEGKYVAFTANYQGRECKFLQFSSTYADFWYKIGDCADVMANIDINEYNDTVSLSIKVQDMRLSGITEMQERVFAARDVYEMLVRGESIDSKLYSRIIPDESHMRTVYDLIKDASCLDEVIQRGLQAGLNYCVIRLAYDVFCELGLLEANRVTGEFRVIAGKKVDLAQSAILRKLKEVSL